MASYCPACGTWDYEGDSNISWECQTCGSLWNECEVFDLDCRRAHLYGHPDDLGGVTGRYAAQEHQRDHTRC